MAVTVVETYRINLLVGDGAPGLRMYGVPPGGWFDPVSREVAGSMLVGATGCVEVLARFRAVTDRDTRVAVLSPGAESSTGGTLHRGPGVFVWRAGEELVVEPCGGRVTVSWDGLEARPRECVPVPGELSVGGAQGGEARLDSGLWPRVGRMRFVAFGSHSAMEGRVLAESDRVGVRIGAGLEGQASLGQSGPSVFGLLQETPDGTVLVHGPDGPTIGGYARLGAVIEADRSVLARLKPGDSVEMVAVSLAAASDARAELFGRIRRTLAQVRLATT